MYKEVDEFDEVKTGKHRKVQSCQGTVLRYRWSGTLGDQWMGFTEVCGSRGELTRVGKKLLCHSCKEQFIADSRAEKDRNRQDNIR